MEKTVFESAKYYNNPNTGEEPDCIMVTINGTPSFVPLDPQNVDYAEILKQVADGTLTIADAD